MKKILIVLTILFIPILIFVMSCSQEISCEGCNNNPPGNKANISPIAKAGPDQVITLPNNRVSLYGSDSRDPDGRIIRWLWTWISGPVFYQIDNPETARTAAKNLTDGLYQFELKVTNGGGLFSRDTLQITVEGSLSSDVCRFNRPQILAKLTPVGTLSQKRPFLAVASAGKQKQI